jgi:hypothetical protein
MPHSGKMYELALNPTELRQLPDAARTMTKAPKIRGLLH